MTVTELSLEDQIKRTVEFWCWRLSNHQRQPDLEMACWTRVLQPETRTKIETIWRDPDAEYGNIRGVSKYLSKVCNSVFIDWLRQQDTQSRIPTKFLASLSNPIPSPNSDDPDNEEMLADSITGDEGGGYQSFLLADLRDALTTEEFRIIEDVVAGYTVRELAARFNYPKSTVARIQSKAIGKIKGQIEQLRHRQRPAIIAIPLAGRATYRPDRISPENLEAWKWSAGILHPFFPCPHAEASGANIYQDFGLVGATQGPGRFAVCVACWATYWRNLTKWLEREMCRLEWELAGAALGHPLK